MRLPPLLLAACLALGCASSSGGERRFALVGLDNRWAVLHTDSPLQPTSGHMDEDEPPHGYVQFSGSLDIHVDWRMLHAEHPQVTGTGDAVVPELRLFIRPDALAARRLPHDARAQSRRKITRTQLLSLGEHAQAFADAVTTSAQREALSTGRLAEFTGHAVLRVDQVQAGIECDAWQLSARLLAVSPSQFSPQASTHADQAAPLIVPEGGC